MNLYEIAKKHKAFLGSEFQLYFTPGRVNLIGEHVDYEGGEVFPIAINFGTYAFVSKREDNEFHFLSANFLEVGTKIVKFNNSKKSYSLRNSKIKQDDHLNDELSTDKVSNIFDVDKNSTFSSFIYDANRNSEEKLDYSLFLENSNFDRKYNSESNIDFDLKFKASDEWVNFPKGVIKYFLQAGVSISSGLNILIYGNLPKSSGLSSSASLEVLIGFLLKSEYAINTDLLQIAKISKYVENRYMNVSCGIMDQFAVAMSKKNTAIYLNTSTLIYDYIPLTMGDYSFLIANTNKSRTLADSKYNERVAQCNMAKIIINKNVKKLDLLCELSFEEFLLKKHIFNDHIIANRVEHIVTENDRTKQAILAFKSDNMLMFGDLMNKSHDSLRDLYEVSCLELDTLVDSFRKHGAIGSRMTGAGFGGCTISLVKTDQLENIIANVGKDYLDVIGYNASFYPVKASDGARKIESEEIL